MMQYNRTGLGKQPLSKTDEKVIRNIWYSDLVKLGVIVLLFVVFVLSIAR